MKKGKLIAAFLLTAAFSLALWGCKSDDDSDSYSQPKSSSVRSGAYSVAANVVNYKIDTCGTNLTVAGNGHSIKFAVPGGADVEWTAKIVSNDPAEEGDTKYLFATLGKKKGNASEDIVLYVHENSVSAADDTSGIAHKATLTVTYGNAVKVISLTQEVPATNDLSVTQQPSRMVGFGYNSHLGYASSKCRAKQILKVTELESEDGIPLNPDKEEEGAAHITITHDATQTEYREASGSNIAELDEKLKISVNGSLEIAGFSLETEDSFTMAQKENEGNQFAWLDILVKQYTEEIDKTYEVLRKKHMMVTTAYNDINGVSKSYKGNDNATFKKLVQNYGTHVVVGGILGGKAGVRMSADQSKINGSYDAHVMVKAGYEGGIINESSASVEADYKKTLSNNKAAFSFKGDVKGGSSEATIALTDSINSMLTELPAASDGAFESKLHEKQSERHEKYSEWLNSLAGEENIENNVLIDFGSNIESYLVPLYDFIDLYPNEEIAGSKSDGDDEEDEEEDEDGAKLVAARKARRDALKAYFDGQLNNDFPLSDKAGYVQVTAAEIEIPQFSTSTAVEASLVKNIMLPTGTARVAVACSEYIPKINVKERVTVIYPCSNTQVYWSRGVYLGDSDHYPSTVAWNGANYSVTRLSDKKGAVSKVYVINGSIVLEKPKYLKKEKFVTDPLVKDAVYSGRIHNYGLVKIFDHIWMRNYSSEYHFQDGTHFQFAEGKNGERWVILANSKIKRWCGKGFTEQMPTTWLGDVAYVPLQTIFLYWTAHGWVSPPHWDLPYTSDVDLIINRLNAVRSLLPNGNAGAEFLEGGVLGLRIPRRGTGFVGYMDYWKAMDDYYFEADNWNAWLPCFYTPAANVLQTGWDSLTRYVINTNGISYATGLPKFQWETVAGVKHWSDEGDIKNKNGPCSPVLYSEHINFF